MKFSGITKNCYLEMIKAISRLLRFNLHQTYFISLDVNVKSPNNDIIYLKEN